MTIRVALVGLSLLVMLGRAQARDTDACAVSSGSRNTVPRAAHIFGSGAVWFGDGPVYVNFAWKSDTLPPARFSFSSLPIYGAERWPAKTPVVAEWAYTGPIVMRGRFLGVPAAPLMFSGPTGPVERLELTAPGDRPSADAWSFWATGISVQRAGCYELLIDTPGKSERIVFEAAP